MNKDLLDYFNQDELAASTWLNKYALKDKEGNPLEKTPTDMHWRMAKEFARVEREYQKKENDADRLKLSDYGRVRHNLTEDKIFHLFKDFKYSIPQGSVMSALGAPFIASLSNCVVVDSPADSYGGIFKTDQELAQLMKRRCGVGVDVSPLRPEGTETSNAALTTTGAVSFMHRYSNTTREVAQNGRRGALMLSMHVNHPDSLKFAQIKEDLSKVTGANISVKLTDEFMQAVENDADYYLRFPVDTDDWGILSDDGYEIPYNELIATEGKTKYIKRIKAKEHWEAIVKAARDVAEPGLLFWDNMVDYSPDGAYPQFKQISTNPCSEIGMQANDTCRLIAINFTSFVKNPFTDKAEFDFNHFYKVTYETMRLSDDLVDLEIEHIQRILNKIESDPEDWEIKQAEYTLWKKILKSAEEGRRTGLGLTGLADTLASLGIKYDSDEGLEMVDKIMYKKKEAEVDCTIDLAVQRGSFEGWNPAREFNMVVERDSDEGTPVEGTNPYYSFLLKEYPKQVERMVQYGRRNVSISTSAPTGSLSMLAQISSGIEPVFSLYYMRRRKVNPNSKDVKVAYVDDNGDSWEQFPVVHHKFREFIATSMGVTEEQAKGYLDTLNEEEIKDWKRKSPYNLATAPEIDWERRVKLQGVAQKYITHSISSTINLPEDVSVGEVEKIYMAAWKEGLKGITVYREGSRSGVLVNTKDEEEKVTTFNDHHAPSRPKRLNAKLVRFNNNKERWIAFVGLLDGKPYEIFTGRLEDIKIPHKIESGEVVKVKDDEGHKRYDFEYEEGTLEGIDRIFDNDFWNYAKLVSGILRHGMPLHFVVDTVSTMSFVDDHINTWKNGVARTLKKFIPDGKVEGMKCHDCESTNVIFEEGCSRCLDCGSSKCG